MKLGKPSLAVASACLALQGCGGAWTTPGNGVDMRTSAYMAERRPVPGRLTPPDATAAAVNARNCSPEAPPAPPSAYPVVSDEDMPLSPGDLVQVSLPANEQPSGNFKVGSDGVLRLDQLGTYPVTGVSIQALQSIVSAELVRNGYFKPGHARAVIRLLERAPVRIMVSGAVFQPGQATINQKSLPDRDQLIQTAAGDHGPGRTLSNALSNAGGVRPDADLSRVAVIRGGRRQEFDLRGFITGGKVTDPLLAEGDLVEVPGRSCFQVALARPSPITPPGVRVFISNLTVPAVSNATSAVGKESNNIPYGTRFLQGLVSGNCIGGTQSTNANRYGVLMSYNPITGESEVVERKVEDLVRRADRDSYNPILVSGDAIACYDSPVTNIRDVIKAMTESLLGLVKPGG